MAGGNGNDELYGGNQNDRLYGNLGNDWLAGQWHTDLASGGWGEDLAVGENPVWDPDNSADKRAVANVFAQVARFCNTGCIAGSASTRPIQPVAGPPGTTYDRVQYVFDSEGFILEMTLLDSTKPNKYQDSQVTEISASGFLDAFGSPRTYQFGSYRATGT